MAQSWELLPAQENEQQVTQKNERTLKMRRIKMRWNSLAQSARAIQNLKFKVQAQTEERTRKGIGHFPSQDDCDAATVHAATEETIQTLRPLGEATAVKARKD